MAAGSKSLPPEDQQLWEDLTSGVSPLPPLRPKEQPPLSATRRRLADAGGRHSRTVLDCHGLTAEAAYTALEQMLESAFHEERREVKVITGKGKGEVGLLKDQLPRWVTAGPLARYVRSVTPDSGGGAFTLSIRKPARGA